MKEDSERRGKAEHKVRGKENGDTVGGEEELRERGRQGEQVDQDT